MKLRTRLAIYAAKLVSTLIRKMHKGDGATLPGYVAQRIDPGILTAMSGMVKKKTIAVMGTNGKTTTNSIINHVLASGGKHVIINRTGANMLNGITSAFALAADGLGRLHAEYACIEVDENASVKVLPQLKPDCIVLTNLSRDQLDRYGEVDIVRAKIRDAVSSVPDAVLILNSDDVISYTLANECPNPVVTFGISERIFTGSARAGSRESIFCRECGTKLSYDFFHYGQLGIWHCPKCGAARPEPDYDASNIACQDGTYSFTVDGVRVNTKARSTYNVYNTLAAFAALSTAGAARQFAVAVERFDYGNNRESIFMVNGARIQLHLAKNPIGFQQKISLVQNDEEPKDVIIQINDTAQDGKDISWLWDVDFQFLGDANAAQILVAGTRRYDMGLRLKYDGIPCTATEDMRGAIEKIAAEGTKNIYVIVNYSGLYRMNRMLTELEKGTHGNETHNRAFISRST